MRSKLVLLPLVVVAACKGDDRTDGKPSAAPASVTEAVPLPAGFPLPASSTRKLVRSSSKLGMTVWEYEYADRDAAALTKQLADGLPPAGYAIASATAADIMASRDGETYAIGVRPRDTGATLAIRAFAESGPATLPAPQRYPAAFPFLAGGTTSHAPDGGQLRIAYQQDPRDLETAMVLAANRAGWTCKGSGDVTCVRGDGETVAFTTRSSPGGSVLLVTLR